MMLSTWSDRMPESTKLPPGATRAHQANQLPGFADAEDREGGDERGEGGKPPAAKFDEIREPLGD